MKRINLIAVTLLSALMFQNASAQAMDECVRELEFIKTMVADLARMVNDGLDRATTMRNRDATALPNEDEELRRRLEQAQSMANDVQGQILGARERMGYPVRLVQE